MRNYKSEKNVLRSFCIVCIAIFAMVILYKKNQATNGAHYSVFQEESGVTHEHDCDNEQDVHSSFCNPTFSASVWVSTKGGTRYHTSPRCSNMKEPEKLSVDEAVKRGFTPCQNCY